MDSDSDFEFENPPPEIVENTVMVTRKQFNVVTLDLLPNYLLTKMITVTLFIIFLTLLGIIFFKHMKHLNHWKEKGVFYPKPIPVFGNIFDIATFSKPVGEAFKAIYETTDKPYLGFFLLDQPVLMVKSPQLIKRILIKDFDKFRDRTLANSTGNEIFRNFLLLARSGWWKQLRNQLTPLFTSGKLKGMVDRINDVSADLMSQISTSKQPICVKEIYTNFMTEAMARCFFNIHTGCLDDEKSIFREILRKLFHPSWKTLAVQLLYFVRTSWVNYVGFNFVDGTAIKYLIKVFKEVIETRKGYNPTKPKDIVDIMIINKNKEDSGFGKTGHFASGVQFLVAGIETTSTGLSWFMFEMSQRQDIQERLRTEIVEVLKKHKGKVTYAAISDMKYLDLCYLETLRRYPFVPFLDRQAIEDYKIEETGFVIEKGTYVFIPLYPLSMDEKYYPDPYNFIPERFADSNHAHANDNDGLVYMPFGAGQRICLGERFAIISSKQVIVNTLINYKIEKCKESPPYPVKFNPRTTFLECEGGIPVKFTKINVILNKT